MTDNQRRALHLANRKRGAIVKLPGRRVAPDQIAYQTAQVLISRGLAVQLEHGLLTTNAGRKALAAPQYDDGLYLHVKLHKGYTDDPRQSPKGEPQVMEKPSTTWQMASHRATAKAKLETRQRQSVASDLAHSARTGSGKHGWRTTAPKASVTISQEPPTVHKVIDANGLISYVPIGDHQQAA